ncbi:hypothetical protein [Frigoriglobus tundricola]|uniref:Uncharacterized protein n=1 Tax=Frigoriglobus tundricola TaxID=2774151 RepID=A0A6M5YZV6_9BACT|nr:hypothetical protein [Frigoriglobus tundricola]QJW99667.1 hypothetical protein FTUN_7286 [Frigoriglobus tundricola]
MATSDDPPDPIPANNPLPNPSEPPPKQDAEEESKIQGADWRDSGDLIDAGVEESNLGGDLAAGAIRGAADVAGAAVEAAVEGVGTALEVLCGCGEGCAGCSSALVVFVTLLAAAGSAMALFR